MGSHARTIYQFGIRPLSALASLQTMLQPGDHAPDFELPDQNGDSVELSALKGQTVVLYFYPRADPGINSVGLP